MAFRNKIEKELVSNGLWKQITNVLSQGVGKSYTNMAAFNADGGVSKYGIGPVYINGSQYWCNGSTLLIDNGFIPSIYSGTKLANNTSAQSEAIATGAIKLEVNNEDVNNSVYIGLGNSATDAENSSVNGTPGVNKFLILPKSRLYTGVSGFSHYAWKGVEGSASIHIAQGV